MWAANGSANPTNLDLLCLKGSPHMASVYQTPKPLSNRTFTMKVSFETMRDYSPKLVGNMAAAINKYSPKAKMGFLTRSIAMIKQFLEIIHPVIHVESGVFDLEGKRLRLSMELSGCIKPTDFNITIPEKYGGLDYSTGSITLQTSMVTSLIVNIPFDPNDVFWSDEDVDSNLIFDITCDSHFFLNTDPKLRKYISLFTQMKDPEAKPVTHVNQSLRALHLFKSEIVNINFQSRQNVLFQNKKNNRIICVPDAILTVYLGQIAMINIRYDNDLHQMSMEINEDQYPNAKMLEHCDNTSVDFGFVNTMVDETHNRHIIERSLRVKENWDAVSINLGQAMNWKKLAWGIMDNKNKSTIKAGVSNNQKKKQLLKHGKTDVKSKVVIKNSMNDKISAFNSLKMFSDRPVKFSINAFLNLIGQRASFKMINPEKKKYDDGMKVSKMDILKSLGTSFTSVDTFYLEGSIGLWDPEIGGKIKGDHFLFPSDQEYTKMTDTKGIYLEYKNLVCSSVNTDVIRLKQLLENAAGILKQTNDASFIKNKTFYGISITRIKNTKPQRAKIELIIGDESQHAEDFYILRNKRLSFKLERDPKPHSVKIEGDLREIEIQLYHYEDLLSNLTVLGKLIKLFKKDGETMVFDCFFEIYTGYNDVISSFVVHRKTTRKLISVDNMITSSQANVLKDIKQKIGKGFMNAKDLVDSASGWNWAKGLVLALGLLIGVGGI